MKENHALLKFEEAISNEDHNTELVVVDETNQEVKAHSDIPYSRIHEALEKDEKITYECTGTGLTRTFWTYEKFNLKVTNKETGEHLWTLVFMMKDGSWRWY